MADFLSSEIAGDSQNSAFRHDHPARIAERVQLLAKRSQDAVFGVLVGSLLTAAVLQNYAPWQSVASWIGVFVCVNGYRILFSRRILSGRASVSAGALTRYLLFAAANGLWLCALSLGFFGILPLEARVALMILVLLAVAGGAATYASYPQGYTVFVLLAVPPMAFCWGGTGGQSSAIIAVTLIIFGATMIGFSRYLTTVFERSVDIRFDREQVVQALRAEKFETEKERKKAEEASLAKSRFLANASHDLRQPAQALALYTAVLQRSASTKDQVELASSISQASRALAGLLNNLLDLSRLDAGAIEAKFETVELDRLIGRIGSEMAQIGALRSIAVRWDCPRLVVSTDPILLERALRNLLDNAIKFTDEGSVQLLVRHMGQAVVIEITDTGCGIPVEHHSRIFEEFYQVDNAERDRERGLGLGLSIVSRLATLLKGSVHLRSTVSEGSVFTLGLPFRSDLSRATPSKHVVEGPLETPPVAGRRVLVIDDDPMVLDALRVLLVRWGAHVDAFDSYAIALRQPSDIVWHICLCDLRLRASEDGLEAAIALQARQPGLPVIFISGDTAPERIELATKSGHALLHKPVDADLLAQEISHVLQKAAS